ncbi:MAG TPA: YybS family protein [Cerasibacillus sp.]|uniref:YybS family protein n=1 Tax=Cerasibacillus sp. TaxID=2498711 RepID=UPI002F3F5315
MNQSKQITDGALLAGVFIVLVLIAAFIPFVSLIASVLLPIPFIIYAHRYSWRPSLLLFAVISLLTILFATLLSLPLAVIPGIGGIMIGVAMHKQLTPYETWARGTVGFMFGFLFTYVFAQLVMDINLMQAYEQMIRQSFEQTEQLFKQFGVGSDVNEQMKMFEQRLPMIANLFPMLLIIGALFMAFLSQWIGYKIINRMEKMAFRFPPFRHLTFPVTIVWLYLIAILISFMNLDPDGYVAISAQNLIALLGFFMAIQGISFIFFFVYKRNMSKALPIIITIFIVILSPFLVPLVRILGIIDLGFRLRERMDVKK